MTPDAPSAAGGVDAEALERSVLELMRAVRLRTSDGHVAWYGDCWMVAIYDDRKKPPIIRWAGFPVAYFIGGGRPVAFFTASA